ncbi:MAG: flagellar hook-length control protein FliK [Nitrosomonadales bacterium]|nr:MAG: flagellar hook-length control protein FliK [Nitrosomonadales bacterium]
MIHNDIQNQLQLLIKGTAQPLIEVAEHPNEMPQWTLGQRLPAHVLASLPNGRFQVQIDNQILDMNLPRNTQPGVTLELVYAGATPRLTFVLNAEQPALPNTLAAPGDAVKSNTGQGAAAVSNAPAALGETPKSAAGQGSANIGAAPTPDAPVVLSDAAKFIGNLQQKNSLQTAQPLAAEKSQPVLNAPPDQGKPLAEALSKTLSQSGLFYESHQLQWISGERSLAMLRQEPQAQFSPTVANKPEAAAPVQDSTMQNTQVPQLQLTEDVQQASQLATQQSTLARPAEASATPVNAQTLPLVQQQLEVLDSRQIVWQGQVWPGQEMRWEIEEDSHGRRSEEEAVPAWKTRLHLQLPHLGGVTANISLKADGIRVDFSVAQHDSAALLKREQMGLVQSFDAAGLSLTAVTVNQDEQARQA